MASVPTVLPLPFEAQCAVLADARLAAEQYWSAWLWRSESTRRTDAPRDRCEALAQRWKLSIDDVVAQWWASYDVLTSDTLFELTTGMPQSRVVGSVHFGRSHRRAP